MSASENNMSASENNRNTRRKASENINIETKS